MLIITSTCFLAGSVSLTRCRPPSDISVPSGQTRTQYLGYHDRFGTSGRDNNDHFDSTTCTTGSGYYLLAPQLVVNNHWLNNHWHSPVNTLWSFNCLLPGNQDLKTCIAYKRSATNKHHQSSNLGRISSVGLNHNRRLCLLEMGVSAKAGGGHGCHREKKKREKNSHFVSTPQNLPLLKQSENGLLNFCQLTWKLKWGRHSVVMR